jgi:hypothetical protein
MKVTCKTQLVIGDKVIAQVTTHNSTTGKRETYTVTGVVAKSWKHLGVEIDAGQFCGTHKCFDGTHKDNFQWVSKSGEMKSDVSGPFKNFKKDSSVGASWGMSHEFGTQSVKILEKV